MTTLTKAGLVAGGVALALLLGALWLHGYKTQVLATAQARHAADSLLGVTVAQRTQHTADSAAAARRVVEVRREAQQRHTTDSSAAAAAIAVLDNALAEARNTAAVAAQGLGSLLDSVPLVTPPGFGARVVASVRLTLAAKDTALARAATTIAERDVRYAAIEGRYHADLADRDSTYAHALAGRDASYAEQGRQLDEANRQIAAALKRTTPGLFTRAVRAVPVMLGSIGAWELGKRLFGR